MEAETYLRAYFVCRDRLERYRPGCPNRKRLVRLERKLEMRLWGICVDAAAYNALRELYEKMNLERKALWVAVLFQMVAFLVLLARLLWGLSF